MRDKFGLAFEIVNREYVSRLRRERGVGANPFRSHPRLIVSLEWLKLEPQLRRLDDEFLPPDPNTYPRAFDLLIVDEAHLIAPAAVGNYAQPSLRTPRPAKTGTPFRASDVPHRHPPTTAIASRSSRCWRPWTPNRFATGVPVSDRDRDAVMVRRLKSHLRELLEGSQADFPTRRIKAIEVEFGEAEQEMFQLLDEYAASRRSAASKPAEQAAARFITLLLKKRLLSSPAAFKHTLDRHIETLDRATSRPTSVEAVEEAAAVLDAEVEDDDTLDEMGTAGLGRSRHRPTRDRNTRPRVAGTSTGSDADLELSLGKSWRICESTPTATGAVPTPRPRSCWIGSRPPASPMADGTTSGSSSSRNTEPRSITSTRC